MRMTWSRFSRLSNKKQGRPEDRPHHQEEGSNPLIDLHELTCNVKLSSRILNLQQIVPTL